MSSNFDELYTELVTISGHFNSTKISSFLNYNTIGGKEYRSTLFKLIAKDKSSNKLCCVFELLQSAFVVADDIMDESDLRRGVECYYKKEGMISVRYAHYFLSVLGRIITNNKTCNDLRTLYYKTVFSTCLGQTLDSLEKSKDDYKLSLYNTIAEYKTSFYTFYFPLSAGYFISNNIEPPTLREYCRLLGIIFQMQDDILNFFPEISKKTSNDLDERKLTFFTCKLAEEDSDIVNEYFEKSIITSELVEKVKSYFPEFSKKLIIYINKMKKLENEIEQSVVDFINKTIKKRDVTIKS